MENERYDYQQQANDELRRLEEESKVATPQVSSEDMAQRSAAPAPAESASAERIRKENAYAEAMIARDRIESPAVRNAADLSTQGGTLQHAQAQYLANRRKS